LLRERGYEIGRQRQIGKLHEIQLATVASNTHVSGGRVAGRVLILAALLVTPIGDGDADLGVPSFNVAASPLAKPYFNSLVIASAALPATTQLAEPATTASSSNQRNPKSSMHSGKSGLMIT
jgi:hypothetical protein